ncbi:hypothetical protein FACS1894116_02460 [Betaproteobacteria bacterium]|nr:hypothetical protein FACS1894116_02460 [Betaproteobacteria bacterium]
MIAKTRALWLGIAVACSLILSACDSNLTAGNRDVLFQINWTPDPTFAGAYISADKTKNFFSQEGLSVDIQVGGFGIDPLAPLVAKKAQFAVVGADKAAVAFANGAPIRVVAVEFQRNPVGWIVRRSKGVKSVTDLLDRRDLILGDKVGTEISAILRLMLRRTNLEGKLSPQAVGFDLAYFLQNENVVYPVYLNEEPVTARTKGLDIVEIDPAASENGAVRLYGNVIIAHSDTVRDDPKLIQAFVRALRKGWLFAKSDPKTAESILRKNKAFDTPQLPDILARSIVFATSSNGIDIPPGHMEVTQWESTLRTLRESGLLIKDINLEDFVWFDSGN